MQMDAEARADAVRTFLVASRALVGVAARSLADANVTLPQFRALVVLGNRPETTVSVLAEALDIHPTTATRLVDRLVRNGLVARRPAVDDRRVTHLELLAAGSRLVDEVTARREAAIAEVVGRMSAAGLQRAVSGMRAFAAAAGEPEQIDLFGWGSGE